MSPTTMCATKSMHFMAAQVHPKEIYKTEKTDLAFCHTHTNKTEIWRRVAAVLLHHSHTLALIFGNKYSPWGLFAIVHQFFFVILIVNTVYKHKLNTAHRLVNKHFVRVVEVYKKTQMTF